MADDEERQPSYLIPPPPEEVIRNATTSTTGGTAGTDTVQETPERIAARAEIDKLNASHQEAMNAQAENDKATALIHQQTEQAKLAQMDADAAERDKAYKATQPGIDEWRSRLRESMDKFDKAPAPALFADKSTSGKVLSAIGLALAGLGDAIGTRALITSRQTGGLDQFNMVPKLIEADLQLQREALSKLSDRIAMAKTGLGDAQAARAQLLAEVDQRGAIAFKRADLVASARLYAQGKSAADVKATLDHLGWEQKGEDMKLSSVAPLVNHVTESTRSEKGTEFSHTLNVNQKPNQATTPTHMPDSLTGKDLPVDPTATTARQHQQAVDKLTATNTMIETGLKLLKDYDANGLYNPEVVDKAIGGGKAAPQGERNADLTRLRSAYPASRGESVSKENMAQIEAAVPAPPSDVSLPGAGATWRAKVKAMVDENIARRDALLQAAGVPTAELPKVSAGQVGERAKTRGAGLEPTAQATSPAAAVPATERERVIERIKARPHDSRNALSKKVFNITDQELAAP